MRDATLGIMSVVVGVGIAGSVLPGTPPETLLPAPARF